MQGKMKEAPDRKQARQQKATGHVVRVDAAVEEEHKMTSRGVCPSKETAILLRKDLTRLHIIKRGQPCLHEPALAERKGVRRLLTMTPKRPP